MSRFDALIEKKNESAQYMVDEITHICRDMPKRSPGTEGEKVACEYMANVLKEQCGCETVKLESFKENPGSFLGWLYFTLTMSLAGFVLFWFVPVAGAVIVALGFFIMIAQFIFYKKLIFWCQSEISHFYYHSFLAFAIATFAKGTNQPCTSLLTNYVFMIQ